MSRSLRTNLFSARQCELRFPRKCLPNSNHNACRFNDDLRPLQPISRSQFQLFSTTQRCRAVGVRSTVAPPRKAVPSMAVQMAKEKQKAMREAAYPDDLGLIPDTFVMPSGKNLPGWLANAPGRWRLEKKRFWVRLVDMRSAVMYRVYPRPRPRLHLSKIPGIAKDLHKNMYEHFAAGNLRPIESSICSGLLSSLRERIGQRPPNITLRWHVHKYLSKPKLVSYKAALLPQQMGEGRDSLNGLVQAVVRIHSSQSLQHVKSVTVRDRGRVLTREVMVDSLGRELVTREEAEEAERRSTKESVEYVVVQKSFRKSREAEWMVWGTTEETLLEKLDKEERRGKGKAKKGR